MRGFKDSESYAIYGALGGGGGYINPNDVQTFTGASAQAFHLTQILFSTIYKWAGNPGGSSTNKNDVGGDDNYNSNSEKKNDSKDGKEKNPLKNTHGERLYTMEEFLEANQGLEYEDLINQRPKSQGMPGGPFMRYVENPKDGNVMDMRHVLVVGYKGTNIGGLLVEIAQWLGPFVGINSRGSAFDKQDYYSNNIGATFFDFMAHPASSFYRRQDFTTVFYNYIHGKYTIPVWK